MPCLTAKSAGQPNKFQIPGSSSPHVPVLRGLGGSLPLKFCKDLPAGPYRHQARICTLLLGLYGAVSWLLAQICDWLTAQGREEGSQLKGQQHPSVKGPGRDKGWGWWWSWQWQWGR